VTASQVAAVVRGVMATIASEWKGITTHPTWAQYGGEDTPERSAAYRARRIREFVRAYHGTPQIADALLAVAS
jgi:hypothetical protein